jgi:photosystem II stability/assembly factor-like uncharacterized protein
MAVFRFWGSVVFVCALCQAVPTQAQQASWRAVYRDSTALIRGFAAADSTHFMTTCWRPQETFFLGSSDAGRTWVRVFTDSVRTVNGRTVYLPQIQAFAYPSRNVVVATGDSGYVTSSLDGGATWRSQRLGDERIELLAMCDDRHGILSRIANPNFIMATSDGGSTWDSVNTPRPPIGAMYGIAAIAMPAPDTYLAIWQRDSSTLAMTTDGGATWAYVPNPFGYRVYRHAFSFLDSKRGWAAIAYRDSGQFFQRTAVFRTTDGGRGWAKLWDSAVGNGLGPTDIEFVDETHGLFAGPNEIYRTNDGGNTWTFEQDGRANGELSWYFIAYPALGKELIALTFGTVLEPPARSSIVELGNTAESRAVVAPNPVARGASICIRVPDGARPIVRAEIVGPLGQIVEQRRYDEAETAELSTVGIAAGAYFIWVADSDGRTRVVPVVITDR